MTDKKTIQLLLALASSSAVEGCGKDASVRKASEETRTPANEDDGDARFMPDSGSHDASGQTDPMSGTIDGVWVTEGYGWIYEVNGEDVRIFEITSETCTQLIGGTIVARDPDPQTLARIAIEIPDSFTFGMSVLAGDAGALHFLADGLVISPPAAAESALPPRCLEAPMTGDLATFDVLTAYFDEHYALLGDRDVDWDALVALQRPRLTGATPDPLFEVVTDLLAPLQDAHVSIAGPGGAFEGRREEAESVTESSIAQGQTIIADAYLVSPRRAWVAGQLEFARLPGEVGYLASHGFGPLVTEDNRLDYLGGLDEFEAALDEIFGGEPMKGLVIDLRTNGGGSDLYGMAMARRLTEMPYIAYTVHARTDPLDASVYSAGVPIAIEPDERPGFYGPVAMLIGRDTVSAGETLALALRGRPGVTLYGEPTQGSFSAVLNHFLPNGWLLGLPNERYVTEAGERFDVVGIPPDVHTPVFSAQDLAASRDSALDVALDAFAE